MRQAGTPIDHRHHANLRCTKTQRLERPVRWQGDLGCQSGERTGRQPSLQRIDSSLGTQRIMIADVAGVAKCTDDLIH